METKHEMLPVKNGRPKRADRYAVAERDAECARMAACGTSFADIAAHFGYSGSGTVANAIKRARDAVRAKGAEELRDAERAVLSASGYHVDRALKMLDAWAAEYAEET
jgi:hypothetical protein